MSSPAAAVPTEATLLDLLDVRPVGPDRYRADFVAPDPLGLYGGQVAAQALRAAGSTVDPGRPPHSLHGYFVRRGDPEQPMEFHVHRERDGGSFSARRVEASQGGEVVFAGTASFQVHADGPVEQVDAGPEVRGPGGAETVRLPRLLSFEGVEVQQPWPDTPWPTRFWARTTEDLGQDRLLHAAALTYLSDISSGMAPLSRDGLVPGPSLDHAIWFHHPARADDWILTDLRPHVAAGGRGWYTGTMYDRAGRAVSSHAQECLFRTA